MEKIEILITNDDGIDSNGLHTLADILRPFGNITLVAPAYPQSGMSAAVSLGQELFYKEIHREEGFVAGKLTGTPASCIKFGLTQFFPDKYPDLIVSGINNGSNASASVIYSGTLGAAAEGALHGIVSVGVSIENHSQDVDLGAIRKILPSLIGHVLEYPPKPGIYLNINFPDIPFENIKGCIMASQGTGIWIKEFIPLSPEECTAKAPEEGMEAYKMLGNYEDSAENPPTADHRLMAKGYVTIVPHSVDYTDYDEMKRLSELWNL